MIALLIAGAFAVLSGETISCPDAESLSDSMKATGGYPGWNTTLLSKQGPYQLLYLQFIGAEPEPLRDCPDVLECAPPQWLMLQPDKREKGKVWIENESGGSLWLGCHYQSPGRIDFIYREVHHVLRCSAWVGNTNALCEIDAENPVSR